jgi:hypothetical protein
MQTKILPEGGGSERDEGNPRHQSFFVLLNTPASAELPSQIQTCEEPPVSLVVTRGLETVQKQRTSIPPLMLAN